MNTPRATVILIADDQLNMRALIQRMLGLEGFSTLLVPNGAAALAAMNDHPIDLALLDINMPGVDGIGVVEQMRAHPRLRRIPVIMVTGSMDVDHVKRCKELGVSDYLVKPYKLTELLRRIQGALVARPED